MALHSELASGRWHTLALSTQLANIGSEVSRAARAQDNPERRAGAVARGLELFDLTLADPRWRVQRAEIARQRGLLRRCPRRNDYGSTFAGLQPYFDRFALVRG